MGLIPINRGEIKLNGRSIQKLATWQRVNLGISFLQSRNNIFQSLTVQDMFKITKTKESRDLYNIMSLKMSDLSGGEKQRVLLYCRKNKHVECQLLDEPFLALDSFGIQSFVQSINGNNQILHLLAMPSSSKKSEKLVLA